MQKVPLSVCSLYVTGHNWRTVITYFFGVRVKTNAMDGGPEIQWGLPGWWKDISDFYHRGRYGWAPCDVWNLHSHTEKVLAESLVYLSETSYSFAPNYPSSEAWKQQLRDWATELRALHEFQESDEYFRLLQSGMENIETLVAKEAELMARRDTALRQIVASWEYLWD